MDRHEVQQALAALSHALYRGNQDQREEIRDQIANLLRVADTYIEPPNEGLTGRHLQGCGKPRP